MRKAIINYSNNSLDFDIYLAINFITLLIRKKGWEAELNHEYSYNHHPITISTLSMKMTILDKLNNSPVPFISLGTLHATVFKEEFLPSTKVDEFINMLKSRIGVVYEALLKLYNNNSKEEESLIDETVIQIFKMNMGEIHLKSDYYDKIIEHNGIRYFYMKPEDTGNLIDKTYTDLIIKPADNGIVIIPILFNGDDSPLQPMSCKYLGSINGNKNHNMFRAWVDGSYVHIEIKEHTLIGVTSCNYGL